jgi:phage repressor protein C with HTH and peptisase S24 domain
MLPALGPGRIVIGVARSRQLRPGDIVIIHHNGLEKIKRIQKMRPGLVFVVGDNSARSTDSRTFGWLSVSAVRARIIWPRR